MGDLRKGIVETRLTMRYARPLATLRALAGGGTRDVVLSDTRRLKEALDALHARCHLSYYEGERHAFHALVWRPAAKAFFCDTFAFLRDAGV